jgi:hypothetical protein
MIIEAGQRRVGDRLDIPESGLSRDRVYMRCQLDDSAPAGIPLAAFPLIIAGLLPTPPRPKPAPGRLLMYP